MLRNSPPSKSAAHLGAYLFLGLISYFVYYLLIGDHLLGDSITRITIWSNNFTPSNHILTVGLIPIYLSVTIFGAAISSIYAGSVLQKIITIIWYRYRA